MGADLSEVARFEAVLDRKASTASAMAIGALAKAGHDIEASAKVFAPVDTGMLRNSIGTTVEAGGTVVTVAAGAHYAAFVEYGTVRAAAQPFMWPAVERHVPALGRALAQLGTDLRGGS